MFRKRFFARYFKDKASACSFTYLILMLVIFSNAGCSRLPTATEATDSRAYLANSETYLGQKALDVTKGHDPLSGFLILETGQQAFLERANLIELAEKSIDAQYYIWNSDASGRYLARRLLAAAERGVRVRLLLDDMNVADRDAILAAMDRHPNIEIRIYNPSSSRGGPFKNLSLIRDFKRINRRMHNKTFTVDSAFAIVGGRNIGDEYFDLHETMNHVDRDVLAAGPIVSEISNNFDNYWNNTWSYPIANLVEKNDEALSVTELPEEVWRKRVNKVFEIHKPSLDFEAVAHSLNASINALVWADAELIYDPAVRDMQEDTDRPKATAVALGTLMAQAQSEVIIESAYFILGERQLELIDSLKKRHVRVAAITNSLATNDLTTNHAGYARWRPEMLRHGIELHELRPDAAACVQWIMNDGYCKQGDVSLHAKSAVFDRKVVYIGSFNVNLRSIFLNGETVLIIYSPELAERLASDIEMAMAPENSWRVTTDAEGSLKWQADDGNPLSHEPGVGWWRRLKSKMISNMPIEKYL